jgi:hypothetical protein
MDSVLQVAALCGLFLGCGLILGAFISAKGRISHSLMRLEDDCNHDWRVTPEGKTCFLCKITRKKERRLWTQEQKEKTVERRDA